MKMNIITMLMRIMSKQKANYSKPFFGFDSKVFYTLASRLYTRPNGLKDCTTEKEVMTCLAAAFTDRIKYIEFREHLINSSIIKGLDSNGEIK